MNTVSTSLLARIACRHVNVRTRSRNPGFTFVEMLAVVAVTAVLVGVGAPSMKGLMNSVKLSAASNNLLGSLLMARSEAIKRSGRGVVCKSMDGVSCALTGGWEQGWIVFHDANNNGSRESGEAIVKYEQALSRNLRVTGNLNVARYVSYGPTGSTRLVSGGFQAGTLTLCTQSAQSGEARQIILSSAGRPRVQKTTVAACA